VDLGQKLIWLVIIAGVLSAIIIGVIKVGDVVVRRRTRALLAAHANDGDEKEKDEGAPKP
jgi:hypothetical protein